MTTTPWMFWHPALLHMYSYIISNLNNTIPIARSSGTHFKDHWKITMAFIFYLFLTEEFMLKIFFHPQKVCYDRFWMDDAWLGNICHMRKILKIFSKVFNVACSMYFYVLIFFTTSSNYVENFLKLQFLNFDWLKNYTLTH